MFRDSRRVRQLLGLMILTSITLITIDYRAGADSPFGGVRRAAGTVFGPVQRGVSSVLRPIGNVLSTAGNVGNLDDEVKKLRAERAAVEGQKRTNEDKERQYQEARELLKLVNLGQYRSIATHVIGAAPSNFAWTVMIDAGSNRGVKKDQTVVNSAGLVGRVLEVSKYSATVLLAIDLKSTVGGRLAYTGERGFVSGNGPGELKFEVTPATTEVRVGQPVVTAGSRFVPAVPIGEVVRHRAQPGATSRSVVLRPYVDFTNLDLVAVVLSNKQDRETDLDILVPANPEATPSTPPCRPVTAPTGSAAPTTAPASMEPCLSSQPALASPPAAPAP